MRCRGRELHVNRSHAVCQSLWYLQGGHQAWGQVHGAKYKYNYFAKLQVQVLISRVKYKYKYFEKLQVQVQVLL